MNPFYCICVKENTAHTHAQYLFVHNIWQKVHTGKSLNNFIFYHMHCHVACFIRLIGLYELTLLYFVFAWMQHINTHSIYSHITCDKMCMQATIWKYIYIYIYIYICKCRGRVNRQECQERDFIVSVIKLASSRKTYPRSIETSSFWSLCRHQIEIFPRYWPFVRGIHRSPVNSPQKGQWRGALMFSLICAWINFWVNNREAGDLWRHHAHYGVIVMLCMWSAFGIGI